MKWIRNGIAIEEPIVDYLEKLFDEELEKGHKLKVSIGTDSQKLDGKGLYNFATVIMISVSQDLGGGVVVGRGGKLISTTYKHRFNQTAKALVSERMVFEVGKSIEAAYPISPLIDLYEIPLEIHADINPNPKHDSNKALQSAVGYILGMGYDFKIKPDAWAASSGADKLC